MTEGSGIGIPIGTAAHRGAAEAAIRLLRKVNRRLSRLHSKGKKTACRKQQILQYWLYLKRKRDWEKKYVNGLTEKEKRLSAILKNALTVV